MRGYGADVFYKNSDFIFKNNQLPVRVFTGLMR